MTQEEEPDLRLVALGLVPGPAAKPAPPKNEAASTSPAPVAPPPPPPPAPDAAPIFAGMGRFTGMPPEATAAPPPPPVQPFVAPPETPTYTTQAPPTNVYAPQAYTAPPVAPPPPEAPIREAPPPLPPLVADMPKATAVAEAPAIPAKKEKAKKVKPEKPAKPVKAARPEKVAKPKPVPIVKPRFILPPSGVLLRGPIVMGFPERQHQITLEQLGFRISADEPIDVAWTDVREIKARRGRVVVSVRKGKPVAFGIPVEGVSEPTLSGPLARVVKEASGGSLDLAGSAFLELQNASDALKDHFHDEDDPLVPTVVGLVFVLAGLTFTAVLPDALAITTRTPFAPGAFLLDYPLSPFDPRILLAAFAGGAMLAAGIVRVAMGKAATGWARGTLRGWHEEPRRFVELARRGLAAIVLSPAIAAAVLLGAIVMSLPTARVQTIIDSGGIHLMYAVPFFDDDRPWSSVKDMTLVPANPSQHFEGVAVVFTFENKSTVSTRDAHLRGGTDKQLFAAATKWREAAGP